MFNAALKPFMLNGSDIDFITTQVNFRPLFDAAGDAIIAWDGTGPIFDGYGKQLWDGTGLSAADAQAAFGTSYDTAIDLTGTRYVSGLHNNLLGDQATWGSVDQVFTRTAASFGNYISALSGLDANAYAAAKTYWKTYSDGVTSGGFNLNGNANTDYTITASATGNHVASDGTQIQINNIIDYTPRMISLLTTTGGVTYDTWGNHQTDPNYAGHTSGQIYHDSNGVVSVTDWGVLETVANGGEGQVDPQARLNASAGHGDHFIGALNPGVSPSNGFFVLFGQFFDHGLDFIDKGSGATVKITLAADDPLYGMTGPDGRPVHEITINRATVETIDADGPQYVNHTSPYIDQSQTYGSHDSMTQLLREWISDPVSGQFHAGMSLFDGNTLETAWTKPDGTVTNETLPTLAELRAHVIATGRDDLSWEDISNLRNRDAHGHVIATGQPGAGLSGSAVLLDMNPRFDIGHLHGFYDKNANGAQDTGEASYGTAAQAAQVDAAITTLDAKVKALYGPGVSFGIVDGVLTLSGLPGPQPVLTGANALYPFVDFSTFSIMKTDAITIKDITGVHDAVSTILLASVGDHYIAGDGRVNENFGLTSIHHIFHEEHNFQVQNLIDALHRDAVATGDLANLHSYQIDTGHQNAAGDFIAQNGEIAWNTDKVFAGVKLIVEMEYQHSAVDQYARNVSPNIQEFVGYSADKNAAVTLEFAQGAFRYGHSTLRETIDTIDPTKGLTGKIMGYALEQAFLSPEKYADVGPGSVLLGMTHQQMNDVDEFITPALNQGLLGQPLDLAAINIARGRDIGLPDLNTLRTTIGLQAYGSWTDFGQNMQHPSSLANFIAAYSLDGDLAKAQAIVGLSDGSISEDDDAAMGMTLDQANAFLNGGDSGYQHIDAWLGGLAEVHQPGGILGETFDKIFVDQIESLMDGDRFYYLYRLAGQQFGEEVANSQLKDLVERNTGLSHLNGNIFGYADKYVDLGATKEVVAAGEEAQTTGNEHKYGDMANVASGTIGIYSNGGLNNVNDGRIVTIKGVQYVQDTRLEDGRVFERPIVTSAKFAQGFDGWTTEGNANVVTLDASISAVKGHGGGAVADLADGAMISQELTKSVVAGDHYTLSMNVGDRADGLPGTATIMLCLVSPDGTEKCGLATADVTTSGDGSWQKVAVDTGVIAAEFDGWKLAIDIVGGSGTDVHTLIDDVSVAGMHQVFNDGVNLDGAPNSGADANEVIAGSAGGDLIYGLGGDDTLYGNGGNDTLHGGYGIDRLYGGAGADSIFGGDNPDLIDGGAGDDKLYGESSGTDINGLDQIIGGSGNDILSGGIGIDKLSAGSGDDKVYGDQDTDPFTHGGDGNDQVDGGSGQDILYGDNGSDRLIGGADSDQLFGGAGDDILRPGESTGAMGVGTDEVLGGDGVNDVGDTPGSVGFDLLDLSDNVYRRGGVPFDLSSQTTPLTAPNGNLPQVMTAQIEGVIGSLGSDRLTGDDGSNWLVGSSGSDTLVGGAGNDVIVGGSIRLDTLIGKYNSGYTHNNDNLGLTAEDQLEDARYQGASHRVLWSEQIDNSGLIDAANTLGGTQFEKHFTEMLRADQFKNIILGNNNAIANPGTDTVVYAGNRDDYQISRVKYNGATAFKITGTGDGAVDGTDLVVNVAKFQFADVTLTAINLLPIIDSNGGKATAAVSVDENSNAVTTVHASDAAVSGPVTYSLAGGADEAKFAINAQTGALTFIGAPNFEAPTDAGTDNVYDVIVQASDGDVSGQQAIAVTVRNIDEAATGQVDLTISAGINIPFVDQAGNVGISSTLADPDVAGALNLSHQWQLSSDGGATWANVPLIGGLSTINTALIPQGTLIRDRVSYTDAFGTKQVISARAALVGNANGNTMTGTANADAIHGLDGNDAISALDGNDVINGGNGNDQINAGAGDDIILVNASAGTDTVNGSTGNDTILATANNVVITLASGFGTGNSVETISGGGFSNVTVTGGTPGGSTLNFSGTTLSGIAQITGTAGGDTITGSSVNNTIVGNGGNDTISGGGGNDTLTGGAGRDTITGGVGADVFVFTALSDSQSFAGRDTFVDLVLGTDTVRFGAGLGTVGAQVHDVYTVVTASGAITSDANLVTAFGLTAGSNSNGGKVVIVNDTTTNHAFVVVDTNNTSGYQSGTDVVFEVNHTFTGSIVDFII